MKRSIPVLGLAACALALAGCPQANQNTQATLTLQGLAVTQPDAQRQGLFDYTVFLSWNSVPGATTYDAQAAATDSAPLVSLNGSPTAGTSIKDTQLQPGVSQVYQVRALDVNNLEKVRSNQVAVTMQAHDASLSAPANPVIVGAPTTGLNTSNAPTAQPTITWDAVPDANAYYVSFTPNDSTTPAFAAVTSTTSVTVGTIPTPKIAWPGPFGQLGAGFSLSGGYTISIQALRTDNKADLTLVHAVDAGPATTGAVNYKKP